MLTPSEIKGKSFKSGLGYDKKDVDQFINTVSEDFEQALSENEELKNQVKELTESISYYKSIEKTLQRALVIAEKTAQDIKDNAAKEAQAIELNAKANAKLIESQAIKQSEMLEHKTLNLLKQYDLFKAHFKNLLSAQLELLNSASFSINTMDFSYKEQLDSQNEEIQNEKDNGDEIQTEKIPNEFSQQNEPVDDNKSDLQTEDVFEFIPIDDDNI